MLTSDLIPNSETSVSVMKVKMHLGVETISHQPMIQASITRIKTFILSTRLRKSTYILQLQKRSMSFNRQLLLRVFSIKQRTNGSISSPKNLSEILNQQPILNIRQLSSKKTSPITLLSFSTKLSELKLSIAPYNIGLVRMDLRLLWSQQLTKNQVLSNMIMPLLGLNFFQSHSLQARARKEANLWSLSSSRTRSFPNFKLKSL